MAVIGSEYSLTTQQVRVARARVSHGFTLIEMLVTITLIGILSAMAVPAMSSLLKNDRQMTQSNLLVMSLNAARSEAIKRDVATGIQVCPTTTGLACNGAASWSNGWIVVDEASGSAPIMTVRALPAGTTLNEGNALGSVTFLSTGMVRDAAAFTMCDDRGSAHARYTQLSKSGSVRSAVGKTIGGNALTCP